MDRGNIGCCRLKGTEAAQILTSHEGLKRSLHSSSQKLSRGHSWVCKQSRQDICDFLKGDCVAVATAFLAKMKRKGVEYHSSSDDLYMVYY